MKNKRKLILLVPLVIGLYSCNIRNNSSSSLNGASSETSNFSSTSENTSLSTESSTNSSICSSSSSEQSSTGVEGKLNSYLISIGYNQDNGSIISKPSNLVLDSISNSLSVTSLNNVYGAGDGVRLGTKSNTGEISFSCDPRWKIKSIVVDGESFHSDENVEISIQLSNGEKSKNTFNGIQELSFEFNGINSSNSIKISTTKANKRLIIHNITVYAIGGDESSEGGNTDPVVSGNTLKYESKFTLTNGKVPSSKVQSDGYYRPTTNSSLNFVDYCYWNYEAYLPSTGNSKLLVVPVDFTDYRAKDKLGSEEVSQKNIYDVFFGESKDTGWESVRTYYEKSSYGALTLDGEVTPWYHSSYTTSRFSSLTGSGEYANYYDPTWTMLDEVTEWAKNTLKIDMTQYDTDKDGLIDGVWMVYANPYENGENASDIYWAYTYGNYDNFESPNENDPIGYRYGWASYSFIYDDSSYTLPDAHTFIHETGHMLGLDDYYNCDQDSNEGVAGGVDMMDYNVGDHAAYSKYLLNWTSPYVIDGTKDNVEIVLKPFESSGECILLNAGSFNDSPFDEYIMIEYYTPTGLNEKDTHGYCGGMGTYSQSGIKVTHIDSRLIREDNTSSKYASKFDDDLNSDALFYISASNTPSRSVSDTKPEDSPYRLIYQLNNNGISFTGNGYDEQYGSNDVLFKTGDSFNMSTFSKFFVNGEKFNNGGTMPYTVSIGEKTTDGIRITITK